jgi:hypothetical protein
VLTRRLRRTDSSLSALYKIQRVKALSVDHDRSKAGIRMPRPQGPIVSAYVQATNSFDLAFADDALVNDQLRDYAA